MNWLPQTPVDWVPLIIAAIVGLILGWLFTRGPARRREEEISARAADFERRWKKTDTELQDARKKAEGLQRTVSDAESELSSARAHATALQDELDGLHAERENLASDLAAVRSQSVDLESALVAVKDDTTSTVATLERDVASLQADLATTGQEKSALEATIGELSAQKEALESQLATLTGEFDALQIELQNAAKNLTDTEAAVNAKETALTEAYMTAAKLQEHLQQTESRLVLSQAELDDVRHSLHELTTNKAELEAQLHNVRGDVAGELAMLTSTMVRMKDDALKEANARIDVLSRELKERSTDAG